MGANVLTLLILEFGLGDSTASYSCKCWRPVLTLLILEFGLGDWWWLMMRCLAEHGLNPSYTGIWSRGCWVMLTRLGSNPSLNPSYTGIWSRGLYKIVSIQLWPVLTLLILEFGLGDRKGLNDKTRGVKVLTLLILEFGLGVFSPFYHSNPKIACLNPSYTGIWSRGFNFLSHKVEFTGTS